MGSRVWSAAVVAPWSVRPRVALARGLAGAGPETKILSEVKATVESVCEKLCNDTKLGAFVKLKIEDLETKKREIVGVFGKTGAGKSSLINAVIGQNDLLPSGSFSACTSVMIKVEGNMHNTMYEAEIEFITKEEWKDEMWPMSQFLGDHEDQAHNDEHTELTEKLSALYGDEWKTKSPENLINSKYFREIPEFLQPNKKILTCESIEELSAEIKKYTRNDTKQGEDTDATRCYWPLVKCVTVKVPHNDLLQHVTLVDLPGNGDRNKSRDQMWKGIIGNCSTVWIVADITRAASDKETWDILEHACYLLGNGGECQRIHFIVTKSDIEDNHSTDFTRDDLLGRNTEVKEKLVKEFKREHEINKHFSSDCFRVFTVSSREFFRRKLLNEGDTEIPELREFLKTLNDCHSETLNYVSGAYGILSLIYGASRRKEKGSAFHKTLKCLVNNGGIHTKKGKLLNLNLMLASSLTNSIDVKFRNTFPNDGESGPFNGVINEFSLNTEKLIPKHKDVELQLIFLKTEEEQIKTKLKQVIREHKKTIYRSLIETIEEDMREGYKEAAEYTGKDSLQNMRDAIKSHVQDAKNTMFDRAKDVMLEKLKGLMDYILKTLEDDMKESIKCSLQMEDHSFPGIVTE
ncbi:nuclear GTPase SLIP-GC-like [Xenentodon cancila]